MRVAAKICAALSVAVSAALAVGAPAPATATPSSAARGLTPAAGTIIETRGFAGVDGEWRYQIWKLRSDGTHAVPLTTDPDLLPYAAAANPAGNLVAFTVGHGSRLPSNGLYVMAINGYGRRNLLANASALTDVRDPTWSPDGKRLAFVGLDSSFAHDIWTVGADGRGLHRVTHCDCAYTNTPRWSPTGNQILWSPNTDDVALLNPTTGHSIELYDNRPSGALTVLDYDWAPDGRSVVMAASPWNDSTPDLYRMPVSGGAPTPLTTDSTLSYSAPHVSPDGRQIVTSVFNADGTDKNGTDLWIVDAATGTATAHRDYEGPYQEEATAWATTCTTSCAPGGRWASLSASFTTRASTLIVTGGVMPGRPGAPLTVTLQKQSGKTWRTVRSARVTTSALSTYQARLKRADASLCRLTALWPGTKTHAAARATTRSFGC